MTFQCVSMWKKSQWIFTKIGNWYVGSSDSDLNTIIIFIVNRYLVLLTHVQLSDRKHIRKLGQYHFLCFRSIVFKADVNSQMRIIYFFIFDYHYIICTLVVNFYCFAHRYPPPPFIWPITLHRIPVFHSSEHVTLDEKICRTRFEKKKKDPPPFS